MRGIRVFIAGVLLAIAGLGVSMPAQSMTCAVADPTLDEVVCGTVRTVGPAAGFLCTKYRICFG